MQASGASSGEESEVRRAKQANAAKQATRRVTCLLASEACNEQQEMRAMRAKQV